MKVPKQFYVLDLKISSVGNESPVLQTKLIISEKCQCQNGKREK